MNTYMYIQVHVQCTCRDVYVHVQVMLGIHKKQFHGTANYSLNKACYALHKLLCLYYCNKLNIHHAVLIHS